MRGKMLEKSFLVCIGLGTDTIQMAESNSDTYIHTYITIIKFFHTIPNSSLSVHCKLLKIVWVAGIDSPI